MFAICMNTALQHSEFTVSHGSVWLLQEHECFDVCTVGKRKPIKMPKSVL
jgi:hypothetical protein